MPKPTNVIQDDENALDELETLLFSHWLNTRTIRCLWYQFRKTTIRVMVDRRYAEIIVWDGIKPIKETAADGQTLRDRAAEEMARLLGIEIPSGRYPHN